MPGKIRRVSDFLPAAGRATVVVIDPARADASLLNPAEREQAARFRFAKDARHWSACRSALRRILGQALACDPATLVLELGPHGKPRLPPPHHRLHFNLSHCRDLALLALCQDGPVGIDLEPADRAPTLLGCESAFCHPEEIAGLPESADTRARALLALWTAKEAALKALGTGLSLAPQSLSLAPGGPGLSGSPQLARFRLHRLSHPALDRHLGCLAAPAATEAPDFRLLQP